MLRMTLVISILALAGCSGSDDSGGEGGLSSAGGAHSGGQGASGGTAGSHLDGGSWPETGVGATGGTTSDAAAGSGGSPPDAAPSCPCLDGVDNYCLYWPHDIPHCDMLLPGGYCDPNGDGDFADADWVRGWEEYAAACSVSCGDSSCSAPSENCSTCPQDCGECPAGCPDGQCNAPEDCHSCPQDCDDCPPACGDGACNGNEGCGDCPQDCGDCPAVCGNGSCDGQETCLSCPQDCSAGASVACSKLGAHNIGDTGPFYSFLAGCPRIAKWLGGEGSSPGTGFAQFNEMTAYKCACGGTTVLRIYGGPAQFPSGADLWNARYKFLESASPSQKAAVDYLESDNECDAGHCWFQAGDPNYSPSVAAMQEYASFLSQWIDLAVAHGYKPLVGNLSVGSPGGDIDSCSGNGMVAFGGLVPALLKARDAGGGWAYHAYTNAWSYDANSGMMPYLPFRYRKLVACFPELASVPLIFTEAGFDKGGNAQLDGYLANGGWAQYAPWLAWFQSELDKDSYVHGALLYSFAPPGVWDSFRLDDHADDLLGIIGAPTCAP